MASFPEMYNDPSIVNLYQRGLNSKQLRNNYVNFIVYTELKVLKVTPSPLMQPAKEYASPHLKCIITLINSFPVVFLLGQMQQPV